MRHFIYRILLFFVAISIVLLLHFYQPKLWNSLNLAIQDLRYLASDLDPSEKVVFIEVDANSVDRFGRWPWDRRTLADGLTKLAESKVVVLDMVFSEATNESSDLYFSDTLAELGNVVGGFFFTNEETFLDPDVEDCFLLNGALSHISNDRFVAYSGSGIEHSIYDILDSYLWNASFSIMPDTDDYLRRYSVFFQYGDIVFPSLGTAALRIFLNEEIVEKKGRLHFAERQFKSDLEGQALLHLYDPNKFNRYSFVDLFDGKISSDQLKDKIIILGVSEAGVSDIVTTPIGRIPGPLVHAAFMSNVLEGHLPKLAGNYLYFGALLCISFPLLMCLLVSRSWLRAILYLLFVLGLSFFAINQYVSNFQLLGYPYWLLAFVLSLSFQEYCSSYVYERRWRIVKSSLGQGGGNLQDEWLKTLRHQLDKPLQLVELMISFDHCLSIDDAQSTRWHKAYIEEIQALSEIASNAKGLVLNASDLGCRIVFGVNSANNVLEQAISCAKKIQGRWKPLYDGKLGNSVASLLNPCISICSGEGVLSISRAGTFQRISLLGQIRAVHQKQLESVPHIAGRIFIGSEAISTMGLNVRRLYIEDKSLFIYEIQPEGDSHKLIFDAYKLGELSYEASDPARLKEVLEECSDLYLDPLSTLIKKDPAYS